ncbi:topoisomerase [Chloropicon primus]|uniref:Topoisomerase n=1 Tax=Chloropicon primus TaxID=1764295 RepID=A0A5B8MYE1_9CHLO|nr:topoisomerase [Chloropicon primus]UPR04806.1 topoisomerase [Chloropicon primus]|eukprot:QDZ25609.1 topoisomerase [Chloropicon primus]
MEGDRKATGERLGSAAKLVCMMMAHEDSHDLLARMKNAVVRYDAKGALSVLETLESRKGDAAGEHKTSGEHKAKENLQVMVFWARMLVLINELHKGCIENVSISQRGLWYKVKGKEIPNSNKLYFPSMHVLCDSIGKLCAFLDVPKHSLGIVTSPKGFVYGRLIIESAGKEAAVNCFREGGHSICGNPDTIKGFTFKCSATCILVIEKETIFKTLIEEGLVDKLHVILVTAKGYPDIATKCFLKCLSEAFPNLPVHCLVDCNPEGLQILANYKFGSSNCKAGDPFLLPGLSWLGILPSEAYGGVLYTSPNFGKRDDALIGNLLKRVGGCLVPGGSGSPRVSAQWLDEMRKMMEVRHKLDIETFVLLGLSLADYVCARILQQKEVY